MINISRIKKVFSKIDRKVLIVLVIILIMALVAGILSYRYLKQVREEIKQKETEKIEGAGWQTGILEIQNEPDSQVSGDSDDNSFITICVDKCGDNFCQTVDSISSNDSNLPCSETPETCPKDCSQKE